MFQASTAQEKALVSLDPTAAGLVNTLAGRPSFVRLQISLFVYLTARRRRLRRSASTSERAAGVAASLAKASDSPESVTACAVTFLYAPGVPT